MNASGRCCQLVAHVPSDGPVVASRAPGSARERYGRHAAGPGCTAQSPPCLWRMLERLLVSRYVVPSARYADREGEYVERRTWSPQDCLENDNSAAPPPAGLAPGTSVARRHRDCLAKPAFALPVDVAGMGNVRGCCRQQGSKADCGRSAQHDGLCSVTCRLYESASHHQTWAAAR